MEGDHAIPGVRMDQTMAIMAIAVTHMINSFNAEDDINETKAPYIAFAIFIHQLTAVVKDKKIIADLLRIAADNLEDKLKEPTNAQ